MAAGGATLNRLFEIPTRDTLAFLRPHLAQPARILEVGCGEGHLARALVTSGHDVFAIDRSERCVRLTEEQGVSALRADWPEVECAAADVVLFTRSLHHLHDLDAALDRALALLRPAGRVMAEDYDVTGLDPRGAAWLYARLEPLRRAGRLVSADDGFGARLLANGGDAEAALDQHDLHSGATMEAALRQRFREVTTTPSPYFYRYALPLLPDDDWAAGVLGDLLAAELELLADETFAPLGRRFVAADARA